MAQSGSSHPVASALSYPALIVDAERRIVFANDVARSRYGQGEDLEGLPCHKAVHHGQGIFPNCPLEEAMATGKPVDREVFEEASGYWYCCSLYPLEQEENEPQLYFHTFEDITERIESKHRLKHLKRVLRMTSACNRALVRAEDERELMQEVCHVAVEVGGFYLVWVGRAERDPEKRVTPIAWDGYHGGFLDEARITWADEAHGRGVTGRAIRTEAPAVVRTLNEEGAEPWRERLRTTGHESFASFPLVVDGEIFGALSFYAADPDAFQEGEMEILQELAADLSFGLSTLRTREERRRAEAELRDSEERNRELVVRSPYSIVVLDGKGIVRYANPAAARLVRSYSPDEIVGRSMTDFVRSESEERSWEILSLMAEGGHAPPIEARIIRTDGTEANVEITLIPMESEAHPATYVLIRDLTERKKAEAELRESQNKLHQSQKLESVGQLAGGVAHDFNNLLTVIRGELELLLQDQRTEHQGTREQLEVIRAAAMRASALTSQLLAFSRQQPFRPQIVNLNDAVSNMDSLLKRTIGEDISIDTTLADNLWPVEIDPLRLEQIVLNLAVNARDAMEEGGKLTLETANEVLDDTYLSTHLGSKPGEHVMSAVSDNGTGIDTETADRIFDPFFTTKKEGKGTGLGLSTVYGIVKQSGGNIWVYSEPGEGTTFKIYLPRSEKEVDWHIRPHKTRPLGRGLLEEQKPCL